MFLNNSGKAHKSAHCKEVEILCHLENENVLTTLWEFTKHISQVLPRSAGFCVELLFNNLDLSK